MVWYCIAYYTYIVHTVYVFVSVNTNDFNTVCLRFKLFHISYYILSVALAVALAIVVVVVVVVVVAIILIIAFVLHSLVCTIVLFIRLLLVVLPPLFSLALGVYSIRDHTAVVYGYAHYVECRATAAAAAVTIAHTHTGLSMILETYRRRILTANSTKPILYSVCDFSFCIRLSIFAPLQQRISYVSRLVYSQSFTECGRDQS